MSIGPARVDGLLSSGVRLPGRSGTPSFAQSLRDNSIHKTSVDMRQTPRTPPETQSLDMFKLYSLSNSARAAQIAAPPRPQSIVAEPKIQMERRVEGGFWWWSGDYDIQSARIPDADGETLCRVEAHAGQGTVTVYDKDDRMIARWDERLGFEKGEAWRDEYKTHTDGQASITIDGKSIDSDVQPVRVEILLNRYSGAGEAPSGDVNKVQVTRLEWIGITDLSESKLSGIHKDELTMIAITDEEAASFPDRRLPGSFAVPALAGRPEGFSDQGNIGYVLKSTQLEPVSPSKTDLSNIRPTSMPSDALQPV